ncbi:MAG TPA: hypothetical protein VFJ57_04115 [Solirubrobacterales bacterium]|nr:hypothetical protein [Solirubrobacterales bacterium]
MDLDKLGVGEKIASASAIALFVFMFFDWFSAEVSASNGNFTASASEGGNAWDALDNIPIFLVIAIIVVLAVAALRLTDADFEPPFPASAAIAVVGVASVLLILYRIIDPPGDSGDFAGVSVDISPAFGIFISLIAAAGITYGGYRAMQEEGVNLGGAGSPPAPPQA